MGTITTSTLADTVKAVYDADYLQEAQDSAIFSQLVDWRWAVTDDSKTHGSTREIPVFGRTEPNATAASEGQDLTPVQIFDGYVTLTPAYYHWGTRKTNIVDLQDYVAMGKPIAREVARNGSESVDNLIRAVSIAGSYAWRYGGVARASLNLATAAHQLTTANLSSVMAQIRSRGIRGFSDNDSMVGLIHPLCAADALADSTFLAVEEYGPGKMQGIMNAEFGKYKLMNLRFLSSYRAKLYLSGGLTTHTATTLNGAIAAGATAATVTSGTGLSVGEYISLGTLEAAGTLNTTTGVTTDRHEMVQLLSVSTNDITFLGVGTPDSATNVGCRFAHADAAAVTQATTVAAIPICGSESILGTYATRYGKTPQNFEHEVATDDPGILNVYGWRWYGGFSRHERALIVAEFAVDEGILGTN